MSSQAKPQVNPQQVFQNWVNGLSGPQAGAKYKAKIAALQSANISPPKLAATTKALQDYQNGCTASVSSGRRAASLNAASATTYYFQSCLGQGADRLMASASDPVKQAKYMAAVNAWAPIWAQASAAAAAVTGPKGADSTISAKVLAAVHVMKQFANRMGASMQTVG